IAIAWMVAVLAGQAAFAQVTDFSKVKEETAPEPAVAEIKPVIEQVQAMGLRERVSQLMLVTLEGRTGPSADDRTLLEHYTPGGVVIPTLLNPHEASVYVTSLRAFEAASGIPLWIGANMFTLWRRDRDAPSDFMQLPSLLALAAIHDREATTFVAGVVADYLEAMGFNLHLGPLLELPPVIEKAKGNLQCLGSDLDFIGQTGCVFMDVLGERKIVSMPTGFPGGGANQVEKQPPILLTPAKALPAEDLRPYAEVVGHGAKMLCVGNVLVPTLDTGDMPACLSKAVMTGLLREQLQYKGVIAAGPIDAAHIGEVRDFATAAVEALNAGADMLYWNSSGRRIVRMVDEVVKAVEAGTLSESVIDAALERVLTLKRDNALLERVIPKDRAATKVNEKKDYSKESSRLERLSITLVQNQNEVLPLSKKKGVPVGITGVMGVRELKDALEKPLKYVSMQPLATARHVGDIEDFEIERAKQTLKDVRTVICLLSSGERARGQINLVRELKAQGLRVVVVLFGYPDTLADVADADVIILAYSHPSAFGKSIQVLVDVLLGLGPIGMRAPEQDLKAVAGQNQTFDVRDIARCPAGQLPVSVGELYAAGLAATYDPVLAIKKVQWDFGDGKSAKGEQVEHAYKQPGRYPLNVIVTDKNGEEASREYYVVVE
ncbi:MAG: hypothetical protein QG656_2766, partial [Candidatus Hydrogenedentes bacterium]|nr:hypothetical protein [Candidatus Hydrogenedentota bacterium]